MVNQSQFIEMFVNRGLPIQHLPDISENLDNKRIPITSGSRVHGPYPYYGASGIVDYVEDFIFDEELLLISEDGANLKDRVTPIAFVAQGKYWVNNHAHILRFKCKEMQTYVEHLINYLNVEVYLTGMAQPKLNQEQLNSIPIPIPDEDRLDSFNLIVRQADKSKFAGFKSQFIEMFGGSDYPKQPLGNLCKILVGKTLPLDVENEGGPIAYIKVADMNLPENDRVVTTSTRSVTEETAKISGILPIGATVFPKNGAAALHHKKRITAITTCVDMNTMGVYSTSDLLDPEFLYAFLVHQDVASLTLTGAIPQIRPKDIAALEIPLPPLERQRRYIGMVGQADKSKFELKQAIEKIDKVMRALMQ